MYKYKENLTVLSRNLRKKMTPEERHLWFDFLKNLSVPVKRQYSIENYIVDFYIPSAKLIIELDGSQHYTEKGHQNDAERTAFLEKYGITVLRFSNIDVNNNFEGVCRRIETIINNLKQSKS